MEQESKIRKGIYLDDVRTPVEIPTRVIDEWIIVRNYDEFVNTLVEYVKEHGVLPPLISLDHDLADEHTGPDWYPGKMPTYEQYREKTGAHCAKFLIAFAQKNNLQINYVCVHSHNPVGATNIQNIVNEGKKEMNLTQDCFKSRFKFVIEKKETK